MGAPPGLSRASRRARSSAARRASASAPRSSRPTARHWPRDPPRRAPRRSGSAALAIAGTVGSPSATAGQRAVRARLPRGNARRARAASSWRSTRGSPASRRASCSRRAPRADKRILATGEPTPGEPVKTTIDPEVQTATVTALGDQYGGVAVIDAKLRRRPRRGGTRRSRLRSLRARPSRSSPRSRDSTRAWSRSTTSSRSRRPTRLIGREISNAHDAACGGTFVQSFANSCNTVFAPLGVEVGIGEDGRDGRGVRIRVEPPSLAAPEALEALALPPSSLGEIESDVALGESVDRPGPGPRDPARDGVGRADDRERRRPPPNLDREDRRSCDRTPSRSKVTSAETAHEARGHDARGGPLGHRARRRRSPESRSPARPARPSWAQRRSSPARCWRPARIRRSTENAWFASYAPATTARAGDRGHAAERHRRRRHGRRADRARDLLVGARTVGADSSYSSSSAGKPITEPTTTRTPPITAIRPPTVSVSSERPAPIADSAAPAPRIVHQPPPLAASLAGGH